jgi:hypothetical protein
MGLAACDGGRYPWSSSKLPSPARLSLLDTFHQLRAWHEQSAYGAMRPYIDSRHREDVIDLLVAVDELMGANAAALRAIRDACPDISTERFDMSPLVENLELFSRDVELVEHERRGDAAIVTVQISGRVPLVHLQFVNRDGFWLYRSEQGDPGVVPLVREITRSLEQIVLVTSTGPRTARQIEREYELRVGSKFKRMQQLALASAETPTKPPG